MPNPPAEAEKLSEIPRRIFERFIDKLGELKTPQDVIIRLKKTVLEDEQIADKYIKDALFPDES